MTAIDQVRAKMVADLDQKYDRELAEIDALLASAFSGVTLAKPDGRSRENRKRKAKMLEIAQPVPNLDKEPG